MRPHRRQPTRLPRPWDSPGKNTGVGCHFLLQCVTVKSESEVAQSCPTLSDPMDCSPPGSSVHGIFQSGVLEWGAIAFSVMQYYSAIKEENEMMPFAAIWVNLQITVLRVWGQQMQTIIYRMDKLQCPTIYSPGNCIPYPVINHNVKEKHNVEANQFYI